MTLRNEGSLMLPAPDNANPGYTAMPLRPGQGQESGAEGGSRAAPGSRLGYEVFHPTRLARKKNRGPAAASGENQGLYSRLGRESRPLRPFAETTTRDRNEKTGGAVKPPLVPAGERACTALTFPPRRQRAGGAEKIGNGATRGCRTITEKFGPCPRNPR